MENIWTLIDPVQGHAKARAAFEAADHFQEQARRQQRRKQRRVVFLTDTPFTSVYVDGRSERLHKPRVREKERFREGEDPGWNALSRSVSTPTLSWTNKQNAPSEQRPKSMQLPRRRKDILDDLLLDARPNTRSAPYEGFLDSMGRSEREAFAASLLAVDAELTANRKGRKAMELSKSVPNLQRVASLLLHGEQESESRQLVREDHPLALEGSKVEANLQAESSMNQSQCVDANELATFNRNQKQRAGQHMRIQKLIEARAREEASIRREVQKEKLRSEREKRWSQERQVHIALQKVAEKAKQTQVARIKEERNRMRQQRQQMQREKKAVSERPRQVPLHTTHLSSSSAFPEELLRFLEEENVNARDFPPNRSAHAKIRGAGFRPHSSSTSHVEPNHSWTVSDWFLHLDRY